eukprot:Em0021g947a
MLPKSVLPLLVVGIFGCLNAHKLTVEFVGTPSANSRFYVLHDFHNTYSNEEGTTYPALQVSDLLLKTMGILKDGAGWAGVTLGNLFSRPYATVLFVVDGVTSFDMVAEKSFQVDQSGLTGSVSDDMAAMFGKGDNVAQHLSSLFGGSYTLSVSANEEAAELASNGRAYSRSADVDKRLKSLKSDLYTYGLDTFVKGLDLADKCVTTFLAEVVMVKKTVKEVKKYAKDGAPDVLIFTFSALKDMEQLYGVGSSELQIATQLVRQTINEARDDLVACYKGNVLVQSLVLLWEGSLPQHSTNMKDTYQALKPYLSPEVTEADFKRRLPHLQLASEGHSGLACDALKAGLGNSFKVQCFSEQSNSRSLRQTASVGDVLSSTPDNVAEERSELFAPIFIMWLLVLLSVGLTLYAVSWWMWTLDPGRDSVIYRNVADVTAAAKSR